MTRCGYFAVENRDVVVRGSDIKLDGVDYKFVKLEDVLAVVTD